MHTEFVIEDAVRIPRKSDRYPTERLEIGQSFLAPYEQDNPTRHQIMALRASIYQSIDRAKIHWKDAGIRAVFTTRVTETGIRVWRQDNA
jgi:hypothetical protein